MPKNKKSWINKKSADTYLVIHRNQEPAAENAKSGGMSKATPGKGKDIEEHIKCGIYFEDDYDYMQHLRDLNEVPVLEKLEQPAVSKIVVAPKALPLDFPDDEPTGHGQATDELEELDPEIDAALEGDFNFDDPENELEDDFIFQANDGILPSTSPDKHMNHRPRAESFNENSEGELEGGDSGDLESGESDEDDYPEEVGDQPMDEVSCAKNAKNRTGEQRLIDDQFERLCDEYDEDGASDLEEEDPEALIEPDSHRLKELVEERKRNNAELVLQDDDVARRYAGEDAADSEEQLEDITIEYMGPKKARWDCESVLTTHSNIYNQPCLIREPSRKQRLKTFLKKAEEDYAMEEARPGPPSSVARSKDETKEERRIRKTAVKEQRRERRVEKKCNKLAFKAERLKVQAQQAGVSVKMTPIT